MLRIKTLFKLIPPGFQVYFITVPSGIFHWYPQQEVTILFHRVSCPNFFQPLDILLLISSLTTKNVNFSLKVFYFVSVSRIEFCPLTFKLYFNIFNFFRRFDWQYGLGSWTQLKNDTFDFATYSGRTPSAFTGPKSDHTYREEHGTFSNHYQYSLLFFSFVAMWLALVIYRFFSYKYHYTFNLSRFLTIESYRISFQLTW